MLCSGLLSRCCFLFVWLTEFDPNLFGLAFISSAKVAYSYIGQSSSACEVGESIMTFAAADATAIDTPSVNADQFTNQSPGTSKSPPDPHTDTSIISQEFIIDPLLKYFSTNPSSSHYNVQEAIHSLKTDGYYVIPSVFTSQECDEAIDKIWDFVQDVSAGVVNRDDVRSWYDLNQVRIDGEENRKEEKDAKDEDLDPWPHTGYSSFPDMFQSLGAGFVLGSMRELLAERVFEPLFGTRELLCSKEGFTFHRPLIVDLQDGKQLIWNPYEKQCQSNPAEDEQIKPIYTVCSLPQPLSEGQHYDQGVPLSLMNHLNGKENDTKKNGYYNKQKTNKHQKVKDLTGFCHIQASISFTNQSAEMDVGGGHFLCHPRSHSEVQWKLVGGTYRATPTKENSAKDCSWVPLTDDEINKLSELGCGVKRVYANAGDVILWRSDLVHAAVAPSLVKNYNTQTYVGPKQFRSVGYCSMLPVKAVKDYAYYSMPRRKLKGFVLEPNTQKAMQDELNNKKFEAYRAGRTGDHRPDVESWHDHRRATMWNSFGKDTTQIQPSLFQRPRYRLGPPDLTVRQAELYGVLPYNSDYSNHNERAIAHGVRFATGMESETEVEEPEPSIDACTARLKFLTNHLVGQDKYLGGMASPCGRYIYGVPGHAKQVIRVTAQTGEVDWIGQQYTGEFKWLRGVEIPPCEKHPSGCCVALPCNSHRGCVLKIDPETSQVSTFITNELEFGEGWLYHGGNLASDGYIYAVPASARRVMKIDPIKETTEYIGPDFEGKAKWYGGILGSDGCIYGIPHNANGVLKINPSTQEVSMLAEGSLPDGQWKWHGGLASEECTKIIGFPNNADSILVINVLEQSVYLVGDATILKSGTHRVPRDGRYKYLGGALTSDGQYAYLFPCDAEYVLRMDMHTDELKLVGPRMTEGENKFQNGFVGRDGCVYGIPQRSSGVLRIVPPGVKRWSYHGSELPSDREIVDVMYCGDEMVGCKDKFEGGVLGLDGSIYCIPLRAKSFVKVVPGSHSSTQIAKDADSPNGL